MLVCQLRQINRKFPAPPYNSAKAKSSGGTHDCLQNRKLPVNEPLEILGFSENGFKVGFWLANLCGLEPQLIKLEFIIYLPKLKVQQMVGENLIKGCFVA